MLKQKQQCKHRSKNAAGQDETRDADTKAMILA
jgi:hypothetical protein